MQAVIPLWKAGKETLMSGLSLQGHQEFCSKNMLVWPLNSLTFSVNVIFLHRGPTPAEGYVVSSEEWEKCWMIEEDQRAKIWERLPYKLTSANNERINAEDNQKWYLVPIEVIPHSQKNMQASCWLGCSDGGSYKHMWWTRAKVSTFWDLVFDEISKITHQSIKNTPEQAPQMHKILIPVGSSTNNHCHLLER